MSTEELMLGQCPGSGRAPGVDGSCPLCGRWPTSTDHVPMHGETVDEAGSSRLWVKSWPPELDGP